MIAKLKVFISDLLTVSKLTRTKNKKLRIGALAFVLNLLIFFNVDITAKKLNVVFNKIFKRR